MKLDTFAYLLRNVEFVKMATKSIGMKYKLICTKIASFLIRNRLIVLLWRFQITCFLSNNGLGKILLQPFSI